MKTKPTLESTYKACKEHGFSEWIIAEQCWNAGYQLGRRRWYWGPAWWVDLQCRLQSWLARRRWRV